MTQSLRTVLLAPAAAILGALAVIGCEPETSAGGNDAGSTVDSGTSNTTDSGMMMNTDAGQMGVACPTPLNEGCGTNGVAYEDRTAPGASRTVTFTTVSMPANGGNYSPRCIQVKVGQSVTFQGSSTNFTNHPLEQTCGPVSGLVSATGLNVSKTVTFTVAGDYGYKCTNHSAPNLTNMSGAIRVVP